MLGQNAALHVHASAVQSVMRALRLMTARMLDAALVHLPRHQPHSLQATTAWWLVSRHPQQALPYPTCICMGTLRRKMASKARLTSVRFTDTNHIVSKQLWPGGLSTWHPSQTLPYPTCIRDGHAAAEDGVEGALDVRALHAQPELEPQERSQRLARRPGWKDLRAVVGQHLCASLRAKRQEKVVSKVPCLVHNDLQLERTFWGKACACVCAVMLF